MEGTDTVVVAATTDPHQETKTQGPQTTPPVPVASQVDFVCCSLHVRVRWFVISFLLLIPPGEDYEILQSMFLSLIRLDLGTVSLRWIL
jgi:hypothetical protein